MSDEPPGISRSEWLVASVIWDHDNLTASEIAERLPSGVKWRLKTVNTFLTRLASKGILSVKRDGRAYRYSAMVPREQCVRAESDSFLHRVFSGAVAPMLAHFCETSSLSEKDIEDLRRILDRKSPASRSGYPKKTDQ